MNQLLFVQLFERRIFFPSKLFSSIKRGKKGKQELPQVLIKDNMMATNTSPIQNSWLWCLLEGPRCSDAVFPPCGDSTNFLVRLASFFLSLPSKVFEMNHLTRCVTGEWQEERKTFQACSEDAESWK